MIFLFTLLLNILISSSTAQIAHSSFFSSMRTINPGVAHLRQQGFIGIDSSKTEITKHQDIATGGIIDGVNTTVELEKTTLYRAGKGGGLTLEFFLDQEVGVRTEGFRTSSFSRSTSTEGKSSVMGGTVDLGWFGVSMSQASYENLSDFHAGATPSLNRITHDTNLDYSSARIGTTFEVKGYSFGLFYSKQTGDGSVSSILFNPATGAANTPEVSELKYETNSYGVGLGYSSKRFHIEGSLEKINKQTLEESNTYLLDLDTPGKGSRLSGIVEGRFGKLALGVRVRQIKGNFSDIEQLISSDILYLNAEDSKSRLETSFNFSYGSGKGISFSGFYTSSESESEEVSELLRTAETYPTKLTFKSYGLSLSYTY